MSFKRKIKRKNISKKRKKAEKDLNKKLGLFDKLPSNCMICKEPFDRKDREQAFTWSVVVKREEKIVNLYCPECWGSAINVIKKYNPRLQTPEEKHET